MNGTNLLHLDLESDVAADWLFDGCSGSELIQNLNPPHRHLFPSTSLVRSPQRFPVEAVKWWCGGAGTRRAAALPRLPLNPNYDKFMPQPSCAKFHNKDEGEGGRLAEGGDEARRAHLFILACMFIGCLRGPRARMHARTHEWEHQSSCRRHLVTVAPC